MIRFNNNSTRFIVFFHFFNLAKLAVRIIFYWIDFIIRSFDFCSVFHSCIWRNPVCSERSYLSEQMGLLTVIIIFQDANSNQIMTLRRKQAEIEGILPSLQVKSAEIRNLLLNMHVSVEQVLATNGNDLFSFWTIPYCHTYLHFVFEVLTNNEMVVISGAKERWFWRALSFL